MSDPSTPMHSAAPAPQAARLVVVMGVSGCGKSTVGAGLAAGLGLPFLEGDSLHPEANVRKMAAGIALTDADRHGWLDAIGARLAGAAAAGGGLVASCSALKRRYRDQLRAAAGAGRRLHFVHVHGTQALIGERMAARRDHYMPASLLASQFEALERPGPDEGALELDAAFHADALVAQALAWLQAAPAPIDPTHSTFATETDPPMDHFTQVILETGPDGRARFREQAIALTEGTPQARLSALMASGGLQLRASPVGFRSAFHCTTTPQWVFILGGQMEIGLQDGSSRVFSPGQHFYSTDTLPPGAAFDAALHGHWSRQLGPDPLVTAFVRA